MKHLMILILAFIATIFSTPCAFAQSRLDIAFEGPWLFYQESQFGQAAGGTATVLIAVAPQVLGHNSPTFSTGDGASFDPGFYCVGFGSICKANAITTLKPDNYPPQIPVPVARGNWRWASLTNAYVLILPMPDSYSADGQYLITLHSTFPTPNTPSAITFTNTAAIGIQLHYASVPNGTVDLLACKSLPSEANCTGIKDTPQTDSGTLRISIKSSHEDSSALAYCDFHVRRAYHSMIGLLDPSLTANPQKAYMDVPSYDDCARCDPQQKLIPSDCPGENLESPLKYSPATLGISRRLDMLVTVVTPLKLNSEEGKQVDRDTFVRLNNEFKTMNPARSQLTALMASLKHSSKGINDMLVKKRLPERQPDLQRTAVNIRRLIPVIDKALFAASGKDCRSPEMLIQ